MTERIKPSNHKSSRKTSTHGYLYKSCSEETYNRFRKREGREMDKEDEKGAGVSAWSVSRPATNLGQALMLLQDVNLNRLYVTSPPRHL